MEKSPKSLKEDILIWLAIRAERANRTKSRSTEVNKICWPNINPHQDGNLENL